eukprot:3785851-Lingulodinium_polyedra.AAC.1
MPSQSTLIQSNRKSPSASANPRTPDMSTSPGPRLGLPTAFGARPGRSNPPSPAERTAPPPAGSRR